MSKQPIPITRRLTLTGLSLVLVLVMLAGAFPTQQVGAAGLAATCAYNHTVASGETLSSIALKYNTTVQEIAAANNLKEPYVIYVGQRLCIPAGATTSTEPTTTTSTPKGPTFTVEQDQWGFITIKSYGMKHNTPYYIRVSEGWGYSLVSTKLGLLKTDDKGNGEKSFRLPWGFRYSSQFYVCMKNPFTDVATCQLFIQSSS